MKVILKRPVLKFILAFLMVVLAGGICIAIYKNSHKQLSSGEQDWPCGYQKACTAGALDGQNNEPVNSQANSNNSSSSSISNSNGSTSSSTHSPSVPSLPKAQVDPVIAWDDNYQYLSNTLSSDATNLDSILYPCGTINPTYNSLCAPYDGSGALPVCQKMLSDANKGQSVPAVPNSTVNNYWQSALTKFESSSQTCISKINEHSAVGSGTDVGYSVKTDYSNAVNSLLSMATAINQYIQQLNL